MHMHSHTGQQVERVLTPVMILYFALIANIQAKSVIHMALEITITTKQIAALTANVHGGMANEKRRNSRIGLCA